MSASRNASIGGFGRFLILFGGLRVPAVLHLLGLEHERLTYRHQSLDFRLTGVEPSRVVREILA